MSQRQICAPWLTDVVTTFTATPLVSTATQFAPSSGMTGSLELIVIAKRATDTTVKVWKILQQWQFPSGGSLALAGSALNFATGVGTLSASLSVGIQVASGNIQTTVTGAASTTIEWLIDARYSVN